MIKVLFVCMGNICRSPMAEAVFMDMVKRAGLDHIIQADSAGLGDWHEGELAHRGTREVLHRHHIPYDGRARQIVSADLRKFDYVVAMDRSNLSGISRMMSDSDTAEVSLFLEFANTADLVDVEEVPDPYYTGRFDAVYALVQKGSQALLDHIRAEHNL